MAPLPRRPGDRFRAVRAQPQPSTMPNVYPVESKSVLVRQKATGFLNQFDFSLNPYSGCAFQCGGCYVPDLQFGRPERLGGWGNYVEVRRRAAEVVRKAATRLTGSTFFMSPVTDIYQPAERRWRITRGVLEALLEIPFDWGLLSTRSPLVLEDLALLQRFGSRLEVGISLPTDREDLRRKLDPKNPPVAARLETARRLRAEGVAVRLHVAPIQPASDDFPRIAGEVADWVWIDYPCHTRLVRPLYQAHGLEASLAPEWAQREADGWRKILGAERVGFGQADFARRWNSR